MRQYKYLIRLVAIFMTAIIVPTALFFMFFWQKSYEKMESSNEAYYNKLNEFFVQTVTEEINSLKKHATGIVANSKNHTSAFWHGEENWTSNAYWYYEAVNEMKNQYYDHGVTDCGVYYYGSDCVITRSCRQTRATYESNTLGLTEGELRFFSEESWQPSMVIFGTTNTSENLNGDLMIGYCVRMGKNNDKALVFYRLSPQDCENMLSFVSHNGGVEFYITDQEIGKVYLALKEDADTSIPTWEELEKYSHNEKNLSLVFSVRIMADSLQMRTADFYKSMRIQSMLIIFMLSAICIYALYLAYQPMQLITQELETSDEGEFEAIRKALHSRDTKINEQRTIVTNLLVDHLLYGSHISRHHLQELGLDIDQGQRYCIYLIEGGDFLVGEMEQLTKAVEYQFEMRLFITDTEDERKNVAIAFLKNMESETVSAWMCQWLKDHFSTEYTIVAGKVVESLDDIRTSFVSCYNKVNDLADLSMVKKELESLEYKEERKKKQLDDILKYLEQNYCDPDMSQTKVAEEFNVSTYTLSRMFNSQVGTGFSEYVNAKRIVLAQDLLITTGISVRDISIRVGLPNYNYFLRLFKATVGKTPTEYRLEMQKEEGQR